MATKKQSKHIIKKCGHRFKEIVQNALNNSAYKDIRHTTDWVFDGDYAVPGTPGSMVFVREGYYPYGISGSGQFFVEYKIGLTIHLKQGACEFDCHWWGDGPDAPECMPAAHLKKEADRVYAALRQAGLLYTDEEMAHPLFNPRKIHMSVHRNPDIHPDDGLETQWLVILGVPGDDHRLSFPTEERARAYADAYNAPEELAELPMRVEDLPGNPGDIRSLSLRGPHGVVYKAVRDALTDLNHGRGFVCTMRPMLQPERLFWGGSKHLLALGVERVFVTVVDAIGHRGVAVFWDKTNGLWVRKDPQAAPTPAATPDYITVKLSPL
jgi:hypothetical protein